MHRGNDVKKRVIFNIDSKIEFPRNYSHHRVDGHHLLIISDRPTWIVLTNDEYVAFDSLKNGQLVRKLVQVYGANLMKSLLSKLEQAHFYGNDISSRRTYPPKLTLYITNRCNLRCIHCYADAGKAIDDELTTSEWLDIVEQYSSFASDGEVTISGGEPTLHPDIDVILEAVRDAGHRTVLFTNGTTKGGENGWKKLTPIIDVVQLSLDGFDEATNDSIRGEGTFSKVIRAYELFYEKGMQIRLSVCAMPQNIQSIEDGLLRFLEEYDPLKKIGLILSPTVTAGRNKEGKYAFDYPELQEAIGDELDEIWRSGWRFPNTFQRNDHQPRCGIGSSILISPNGGFRACTFAPISGNAREERLQDWYKRTQETLEMYDVDNIPLCRDCDLRHICLGGCVVKMENRARCTSSGPCTEQNKQFYYKKLVRESLVLFGERTNGNKQILTEKGGN